MSKSGYFGIGMWQTQQHIMNFQVGMFFLFNTAQCGKNKCHLHNPPVITIFIGGMFTPFPNDIVLPR